MACPHGYDNPDYCEACEMEKAGRHGCDCCDPTSPSPDPVVRRLEGEVERLQATVNSIHDAIRERHVAYADLPLPRRVEAVCDALTDMRRDNEKLRGLLREACEAWKSNVFDKPSIHWKANRAWHDKATAALETSP